MIKFVLNYLIYKLYFLNLLQTVSDRVASDTADFSQRR